MASSTCIKCGGHLFEIKQIEPIGSAYKLHLVQCATCGGPVGTQDYFNLGSLLVDQEKMIKALSTRLTQIESNIINIINGLNQLIRRRV